MKRKIVIRLLFVIQVFFIVSLSSKEWKTYTSMYQTTAMCMGKDVIWCGTTGGLLAFDPISRNFYSWTNTEGLASNRVTAITCSENDEIWIGFENGLIQLFDPVSSSWSLIDDYRNYRITCFALTGDTLFVGLNVGVSLYLISRQEVKETYRHLGEQIQVETPANEILVANNQIWVATDEGIAYSTLNYINLLDPSNWINVTLAEGLPDNKVHAISIWSNTLFAGTEGGVAARETQDDWVVIHNGLPNVDVVDLADFNDALGALTSAGIYLWNGQEWNLYGTTLSKGMCFVNDESILWVGTDRGLTVFNENQNEWEYSVPNTPGDNRFSDIAVDQNGTLLCCTAQPSGNGFSIYDGMNWSVYNRFNLPTLQNNDIVSVTVDYSNNRWFGGWGSGLIRMKTDDIFEFYNAVNGYLSGIIDHPNYAVVSDMTVDSSGTLWLLNYYASNNEPLISVTGDFTWTYYGLQEGISSTLLTHIVVDSENRKWIGSGPPTPQGIFILDDHHSPSDKSDDPPVERLATSSGLESNEITALAVGKDGSIWIGTPKGLHVYFDGVLNRRYGPLSNNITALVVDGVNNLWVGTAEGLSLFANDTYSWSHYTTDNSDLADNYIASLFMDNNTGILYIGTNQGLSQLTTPYSEPRDDLSQFFIYPNPFIPTTESLMTIDNLAWNTSVSIFTLSGFLVRRFSSNEISGKRLLWDGTDENGEPSSGGIYLVVAYTGAGERIVNKFALIR
ncbi:hypothetical protein JW824_01065 [bacterium]|nr:hypothetical protein [bacterium]RQV98684.1 MAG: hypothetical protein EH221_01590 [bacterium]